MLKRSPRLRSAREPKERDVGLAPFCSSDSADSFFEGMAARLETTGESVKPFFAFLASLSASANCMSRVKGQHGTT